MEKEDFVERMNEWNDKYKDTDYKIVEKSSYGFFKVLSVLFFILFLVSFLFIVYIWYINDFKGIIQTNLNNSYNLDNSFNVSVENTYDFNPYTPIDNQVYNEYYTYNNYTIINNICNSS